MPEMLSKTELARIAIGRNWESYYRDRWVRYESGTHGLDWNWAAAFLGFFWFWYRMMPVLGIVELVGVGLMLTLADALHGPGGYWSVVVIVRALVGILANPLLFRGINATIRKLELEGADKERALKAIAQRHGTTLDYRLP